MNLYDIELLTKHTKFTIKTPEQIKKQGTRGLLTHYKSLHSYTTYGGYCQCCGEAYEDLYGKEDNHPPRELVDGEFSKYKSFIKEELNSREHIEKKSVNKENPNRQGYLLKKYINNKSLYTLSKEDLHKLYDAQVGKRRFGTRSFPFGHSLSAVMKVCESVKYGVLSSKKEKEG